jgi:UDP-N-acetyl-D-mannosaminuronic acid dehydrogenase
VWELISLANRHPRINILQPGPGVGGHCIAVDPWFIVNKTPEQAQLIHTARKVNDAKPQWVINKVKLAIADFLQANPNKTVKDVTVACYGLAFKPDIDDLRESPALNITKKIAALHFGSVIAIEPNINKLPSSISTFSLSTLENAKQNADIHLLLVDHKEFKDESIKSEYLIDTKGVWM